MARKETIRFLLSNFDSDGTAARKSKLGETTLQEGGLGFREEISPCRNFKLESTAQRSAACITSRLHLPDYSAKGLWFAQTLQPSLDNRPDSRVHDHSHVRYTRQQLYFRLCKSGYYRFELVREKDFVRCPGDNE